MAFPISFGIIAIASPAVAKFFGEEYLPSVFPLQILLLSMPFNFLAYVNGALINASGRQKVQTTIIACILVLSIGLNLVLLPIIGILGASISALVSSFVMVIVGYLFSRTYVRINMANIFKYFNQTFWPAFIMAVVVYLLSLKINFILTIPIGAMVYGILIFITGAWDKGTVISIYKKILKKN